MQHQDFILFFHGFILLLLHGSSASHQRRGLGAGVSQVADFNCPEEFGYYPHPTDCTQYYVCVFGGALLESCTGGLMYSHELQTCDWPRNVGCGESSNSDSGTVSSIRVTDSRSRTSQSQRTPVNQQQNTAPPQPSRTSHRQDFIRHRQPEVIQQQLYAEEDLGPAEEIESDRQQRVYRGQPSTIGQVQRDRDGLRQLKTGVHSQNVIPTGPETQEKISVVSFGSQRPSAPRPQDQYSKNTTDFDDLTDKSDDSRGILTRRKRQISHRIGSYQPSKIAKIPVILIPDERERAVAFENLTYHRQSARQQPVAYSLEGSRYSQSIDGYYRPDLVFRPVAVHYTYESPKTRQTYNSSHDLKKLTQSTIQSEFRPMVLVSATPMPQQYQRFVGVSQNVEITPRTPPNFLLSNFRYNLANVTANWKPFWVTPQTTTTERVVAITSRKKYGLWQSSTQIPVLHTTPQEYRTPNVISSTTKVKFLPTTEPTHSGHYRFIETPKNYKYKGTTEKPRINLFNTEHDEKNRDSEYYDDYDQSRENTSRTEESISKSASEEVAPESEEYYDSRAEQEEYDDEYFEALSWQKKNRTAMEEVFHPENEGEVKPRPESAGASDRVNMQTIHAIAEGLKRPVKYRSTTVRPTTNQIEEPRKTIPEEYYENFKPFPTHSLIDDERHDFPVDTTIRTRNRVEPVQTYQVTSALPPLTQTPRIERYNTSQRYQPSQFDQYYTVYDEDPELYRHNGDYGAVQQVQPVQQVQQVQPEYHTPSSTPSSNIVHQYRGQTTFKSQQALELEQAREPIRNSFSQDVYSPQPVIQDFNDQYNAQIDEQQYQHLGPSTPKPPNRSVSTNSSKDTFPQSSVSVSSLPDNKTSKPETTSTLTRRSDSNSYFEPSTFLVPPPRVGNTRPSTSLPRYSFPTESYRAITPSTQRSAEPPRNGGALAKTLNNFDSLLTNFFSSVADSAKLTTPAKASPETIVRSEIGRIHHDPIIITDDYRTRENPAKSGKEDYLAYYVEIQPKKEKPEVVPGFVEETTEAPQLITKDNLRPGQSDVVDFSLGNRNRPYGSFVRLLPNGEEHRNIQLSTTLDIEPILRPESDKTTKAPEVDRTSKFLPHRRDPFHQDKLEVDQKRTRPATPEPRLIENANPYKFVIVERTTENLLPTPTPFVRNPENENRNRFDPSNRFRFKNPKPTESNVIKTEEEEEEEPKETTPDLASLILEPTTSTRKPFRIRVTTETDSEKPRRVVKINRSDLRNQRLSSQKYKRVRKPTTPVPVSTSEDLSFNRENEIQSTYKPIIVVDSLGVNKELIRSRGEEEAKEISEVTKSKFGLLSNASLPVFEKPKKPLFPPIELKPIIVPFNREPASSEKPLFLITTKPQTNRTVTVHENRAITTKPYVRGKFKPSENSKPRFRPTTASPDSETTPGPHLSTRQPAYTVGSTGNEVTVNRGTPPSTNRGTRPTLKPSTSIVSKASEFIDIYRYPPSRPQNVYPTPTPDKSAAKCRKDVCLLPDCNCGGKDIPGGYNVEEIPQLVLLTFDDSVNDLNKGLYADLFERGRVNPNGCPISATFYVSHEWTDYSQVQNLYANGHEIASHSITHSFGEQFSQKKWNKEIAGQREILAAYGGVRLEDVRGMRAPFLAVGGNKMFKMLYDSNFTYDSSMPIYENRPPSWPYTLDYKLFHDCMIPPCPTKSYPGVWEVPMVMWQDLNGGRCSMGDACSNPPTADGVYKMLIKNFERHFTTNRAPFGLYYHAAWFTHEHHKEGFIAFLDTIVNMPEVWLVTSWQAIQYVRDPQPLSTVQNFPPFQCNVEKAKKCNNPKVCNLWHKSGVRYMRTCQPCPDVYPWVGKTGVKNSRVDNEIIEE